MKHICMLAYTFYESDNRVMRYAEALAKRGDRVDVIALRNRDAPATEVIRGVRVYRIQGREINEKHRYSYAFRLVKFLVNSAWFLSRKHLRRPYDLIHVHSVPDFEVFAALVPKISGAGIILDIHDIVPEFYISKFNKKEDSILAAVLRMAEKVSILFSDHVIISNHLWRDVLLSRSSAPEKCSVIMNYPDSSIFHYRKKTRNDDKFIMMYPGTLSWHQGLDIAIRAFAAIRHKAGNAEFHIYGSGPARKALEALVRDLGLEQRVLLKDSRPIYDIARIMSEADLGIVPKRNDSFGGDAFSTKTLEFMTLGVPIILSKTRVDSYYFNDDVVRFFQPEDEVDLAGAMLELYENREQRERQASAALEFVQKFNWEGKKKIYFELVDSLCP